MTQRLVRKYHSNTSEQSSTAPNHTRRILPKTNSTSRGAGRWPEELFASSLMRKPEQVGVLLGVQHDHSLPTPSRTCNTSNSNMQRSMHLPGKDIYMHAVRISLVCSFYAMFFFGSFGSCVILGSTLAAGSASKRYSTACVISSKCGVVGCDSPGETNNDICCYYARVAVPGKCLRYVRLN
ncbi:hypothetical protein V8F06_003722 [Rhypophila decipiens]